MKEKAKIFFKTLSLLAGIVYCSFAQQKPTADQFQSIKDILGRHKGSVLLLLLGSEGCPGTQQTISFLDTYNNTKPSQTSIICLYVPMSKESLKRPSLWNHSFPLYIDDNRIIADALSFFYYPTFYIFDKQGNLRYEGSCDTKKVEQIVKELHSEKLGQPKKIYTIAALSEGTKVPDIKAKTLAGKDVMLKQFIGKQATLILFSRTSCPFSIDALSKLKDIAGRYKNEGVSTVVINDGQKLDDIKNVYSNYSKDTAVLWSQNKDLSEAFGIDAVPFYFIVDNQGIIKNRQPFTQIAAINALDSFLKNITENKKNEAIGGG